MSQIDVYEKALEGHLYDALLEKEGIGPFIDKFDEVEDKELAEMMQTMTNARDSVAKIIETTQRDFLKRNSAFMKASKKIIRAMAKAKEVSFSGSTLYIDDVSHDTHDASIFSSWWFMRRAPDVLIQSTTLLDEAPVKQVANTWYNAIRRIHKHTAL